MRLLGSLFSSVVVLSALLVPALGMARAPSPGAACVAALVDRFAQHCHVVDIDADSWRQKSQTPSKKGK